MNRRLSTQKNEYQFSSQISSIFGGGLGSFLEKLGALNKRADSPICSGGGIYLVGGAVRDLVRGLPSADIDIMLAGDALQFVDRLHANWGGLFPELAAGPEVHPHKPVKYPKYRTAKLPFRGELFPGIDTIDFSSARSEQYPNPGQPPQLAAGDFASDMLRRDFSINALALDLDPERFGTVIDIAGGVADIGSGSIRVLHRQSFIDDPARILRACRFIARFGYSLESETAGLAQQALDQKALATLPGFRLFDEFKKALDEPRAPQVVMILADRGVLAQIDPALRPAEQDLELLLTARNAWESRDLEIINYSGKDGKRVPIEYWQMALGILYRRLGTVEYQNQLLNFGLTRGNASKLSLIRHLVFERTLKIELP